MEVTCEWFNTSDELNNKQSKGLVGIKVLDVDYNQTKHVIEIVEILYVFYY